MYGQSTSWLLHSLDNTQRKVRLICFPPAGSGASIYRKWLHQGKIREYSLVDIDVLSIQLPGRESRLSEPLFTDHTSLLDAMVPALLPILDSPFFLFGHSMGALLAFELTKRLREFDKLPNCLVVSAHRAPHLPNLNPEISQLPDYEFMDKVQSLNGLPNTFMANKQLIELALPAMRADFRLCESYKYEDGLPLQCPIIALGGSEDDYVTRAELEAWRVHTGADFTLRLFPGGHFYFLDRHRAPVLEYLSAALVLNGCSL